MGKISDRIDALGVKIPSVTPPVANYVSCIKSGNLIYISGQLPKTESGFIQGKLGENISIEDAQRAAGICVLNIISQLKAEISDLDRVVKCVKITVFVNSSGDFLDHPKVANGASDLLVEIFGDIGKHTRAAVGVSSLPFGACVEIEAIFEVE